MSFNPWATADEINFIDFLVSDELRNGKRIRHAEKVERLKNYLHGLPYRVWFYKIEVKLCEIHAQDNLNFLLRNGK